MPHDLNLDERSNTSVAVRSYRSASARLGACGNCATAINQGIWALKTPSRAAGDLDHEDRGFEASLGSRGREDESGRTMKNA